MTLLYPSFLWLLIPLGLFAYMLRPYTLTRLVHLLILLLLLLALARPQYKEGLQQEQIHARDILIAVDVSYSMRARDISPDRYRYAKATIDAILQQDTKDNIMLIAFTTNPLLLSPPTTDHRLIHAALEALDLQHILTKGTSLNRLFEKIAQMKKVHREVIVMSDGGEEKDLHTLAETITQSDTRLHILALGTPQGATIPDEEGEPLKDKAGHLVISRLNPLLQQLADATNGTYLTATGTPQQSAKKLLAQITSDDTATHQVTKARMHAAEYYWLPLLLAALLFVMLHTRASRYLLLLAALSGLPLNASFLEIWQMQKAYEAYHTKAYDRTLNILKKIETPSLQQQYALANTYYKEGAYHKALHLYLAIKTRSPKIKQQLYYNIANSYTMLGKYDKAKMYYTRSLQLGNDEDALHNLALLMQLQEKRERALGIAHPKSQGGNSGAQQMEEADDTSDSKHQETSGSGSGTGGEKQTKTNTRKKEGRLKYDEQAKPQPLGSKVYELINKGYIRERKPW